ncbi:hypothetical protein PybrP1_001546 [[Pythium] brassicae (nom. inval.)]|nr:hypothetical protein PybrP1_001546 [[Pythium] brassicae (nom. inval.)]
MVSASASGGRKKAKKQKKSAKRRPVNLQSNFARKCAPSAAAAAASAASEAFEAPSADMFPANAHEDVLQCSDASSSSSSSSSAAAADAAGGGFSYGDFHLHSDGKLKPAAVVEKAAANGVMVMALTDHDTMAGVPEAMAAAQRLGVLVVPGVEISAEVAGGENLHILGYFFPGSNSRALELQLEKIRTGRHKRGKGMLRKLAAMGIKLEWERVLEIAGEAAPGRPHVAQALVERGFVANFREAFARFLHNDGPAYVEGEPFPPEDAIKLIASAGGVSVLAHPWCCKNPLTLVPELAKLGIQGIEVYHDTGKIDTYGYLANESGLLKLGGSDFHGIDPSTECAPGAIPFPRKQVDAFLAHAKSVWEQPLRERIAAMVTRAKAAPPGAAASDELLVWREQLAAAQQACAALGAALETREDAASPSLYRTLRVRVL